MDNNYFIRKSREIAAKVGKGARVFIKDTHVLAESAGVGVASGLLTHAMGSVAQRLIDNTGAVKLTENLTMTSLGVGAGVGFGTFAALVLTKAGLELKDHMKASSEAAARKQLRGATRLTPEQIIKRDAMAVPTPKPADPAAAYNMAMDKASADGFVTEREIRGFKSAEQASTTKVISDMQALQASGVLSQKSSDDLSPKAAYESDQAWAAWVAGEAAALSGKKQSIPEQFAGSTLYMSLYTRGVSDGVDQLKFGVHDLNREFNETFSLSIDGVAKDRYPFEEEMAKFEASIKVATGLLNEAQELTSHLGSEDHAKASQHSNQNALDSFFNSSGFAAASSNQNAEAGAQVRSQSTPKLG